MKSVRRNWGTWDYGVVAAYILVALYTASRELSTSRVSWITILAIFLIANCYVLVHFIRKYW